LIWVKNASGRDQTVSLKQACGGRFLGWAFFAFNAVVYVKMGAQRGHEFLTAYLIEESLSIDNLFVFNVGFRLL